MNLTKDAIIQAQDFSLVPMDVPEWGGRIYLRKWTGKDRALFFSKSIRPEGDSAGIDWDTLFDNMVLAVALSVCDEGGSRIFNTSEADMSLLGSKNGDVIQRIYTEALKINGMGQDAVEDAAKNSTTIPNESSSTLSQ